MNLALKLIRRFSDKSSISKGRENIFLSIEGNIGAGKTTFLRLLNENLGLPFEIVPEPVDDWQHFSGETQNINLLELFYKEPKKYGYIFQSFCFYSRLKNWTQNQHKFKEEILIFERSIYSDKYIFALNSHNNGYFNEVEWSMYNEWYNFLVKHLSKKLNGIIYLETSPEMCYKRAHKRGRLEEDKIPLDYFVQIHNLHENWMKEEERKNEIKVLRLNTDEEFEENEENQKKIMNEAKKFILQLKRELLI